MPRHPEQPLNPFFEEQMLRRGWPHMRAMAQAVGLSPNTVATFAFSRHQTASIRAAEKIAHAFGMPIWELLRGLDGAKRDQIAS